MIAGKDKALLDYVYGQAENLRDFMKRNGYGAEYECVSYSVTLVADWGEGVKADFMQASFTSDGTIKERTYSPYRGGSFYEEIRKVRQEHE